MSIMFLYFSDGAEAVGAALAGAPAAVAPAGADGFGDFLGVFPSVRRRNTPNCQRQMWEARAARPPPAQLPLTREQGMRGLIRLRAHGGPHRGRSIQARSKAGAGQRVCRVAQARLGASDGQGERRRRRCGRRATPRGAGVGELPGRRRGRSQGGECGRLLLHAGRPDRQRLHVRGHGLCRAGPAGLPRALERPLQQRAHVGHLPPGVPRHRCAPARRRPAANALAFWRACGGQDWVMHAEGITGVG